MKAFAQFEVPGAVSAPFLKGLLTKLQLPVPSDEELEAFVTAVETERNTAKPSSDSEVKAVDIGNCTYRANAVAKGELLKYIDNAEHHGEKTKTMYVPSVSIVISSRSPNHTHAYACTGGTCSPTQSSSSPTTGSSERTLPLATTTRGLTTLR